MDELLRELMNRGFLIFKDDTKFVLKKIATPADPREAITDESQPDTSRVLFDDYTQALNKAKSFVKEEDEMVIRNVHKDSVWKGQMRYQHKGLGMRFEDLGEMPSMPYSEAVKMAEQRAQEFADMDENVEKWEVKVFPYKPD